MSLETVSAKRNRVYHRGFDHDEARRLRASGWSWAALATRFGVTDRAVKRVCDPATRAQYEANSKRYARSNRTPCRGSCGRLVWKHGGSGYCIDCAAARRVGADVRATELRCTQCREWKPDDGFYLRGAKHRRGRSSECRTCQTARRREHRLTHREQERAANRRAYEVRKERIAMPPYIVLHLNGTGGYHEVARIDAGSPTHAIEQVAAEEGVFVAVEEKRFQPVSVAPTTAFRVVAEQEL